MLCECCKIEFPNNIGAIGEKEFCDVCGDFILCFDCGKPINPTDNDACVCIQCGGKNRRLEPLGVTKKIWQFLF